MISEVGQGNLAPIFFSGGSISDCVLCVYGRNSVDCMTFRGERIIMVGTMVWKTAGPQLLNSTKLLYLKFQIVHDFRAEAGVLRNSYKIKLAGLFDTQV